MKCSSSDPIDVLPDVRRLLKDAVDCCLWPELRRQVSAHLIDGPLPNISLLPLAACAAAGGLPEQAAVASSASLLLVLSTRWFDDLADRDRSNALWKVVGADQTMTLAAGALSLAWHQLALNPRVPRQMLKRFGEATLKLGAGQFLDLTGGEISVKQAWDILRGKTAAGYAFMCESGGWMAGASVTECLLLARVGEHLGVMIQLLDDLDGVLAPDGKGDLATRKQCNLVLVHGCQGPEGKDVQHLLGSGETDRLRSLLLRSGSAHAVLAAALQERNLALQTLEELPGSSDQTVDLGKRRLTNFAKGVFSQLPSQVLKLCAAYEDDSSALEPTSRADERVGNMQSVGDVLRAEQ